MMARILFIELMFKMSSLVFGVVDFNFVFQAPVVHAKLRLVEGLRLIEAISIGSAFHVGVESFLGFPARAIPQTLIDRVTTGDSVERCHLIVSVTFEAGLAFNVAERKCRSILEGFVVAVAVIGSG